MLRCLLFCPHAVRVGAGTLFWKWSLSPKNPRTDYLEVAVPDPTFTDIVVPGAKAALDWAKKASPAKNCQKVLHYPSPYRMLCLQAHVVNMLRAKPRIPLNFQCPYGRERFLRHRAHCPALACLTVDYALAPTLL